jgi:hypothetical protein
MSSRVGQVQGVVCVGYSISGWRLSMPLWVSV